MGKKNVTEIIRDDLSVPEVYSNRLVNMTYDGAVVILTLATARALPERIGGDPTQAELVPTAVVNNRMAWPEATVLDVYRSLGAIIEFIRQRAADAPADRQKN